MNDSTILSRGLKALFCAAILSVLALMLLHSPARAAHEDSTYSAPALFNQANAFARAGKTGQAILAYERARLLAPNDPDIAANEHVVRTRAGLPDAPGNRFERIFSSASPNTFAWLGFLGVIVTGAALLAMRTFPNRRGLLRAAMIAGCACVFITLGSAAFAWPKLNEAVVIAHEAAARVSPVTVAEPVFKLREGEIAAVSANVPDFTLVRNTAGVSGWVANADLVRIVPSR